MAALTHRPAKGNLLRAFAAKPVPGVSTITHLGWDLGWGHGREAYSAAAGRVSFVRWSANTKTNNRTGGYGNYFIIDIGGGLSLLYAHQPNTPMLVEVGDQVVGGELVGSMGNTGNAAGVHLHFEVRLNGVPTDPAKYFAAASQTAGDTSTPLPATTPANTTPERKKTLMAYGVSTTNHGDKSYAVVDGGRWATIATETLANALSTNPNVGKFTELTVADFYELRDACAQPAATTVNNALDPAALAKLIAAVNALPVAIAAENARRVAS